MPLVKSVVAKISVDGVEDAKLKIDEVRVKADELKHDNPTLKVKIDAAAALAEARLLRAGLKAEFDKSITETVKVRQSLGSKFLDASGLGPNGGSGFASGLDNLPFGGLAGLAAALPIVGALLVEAGGLVAGFAAATAGVGAFGLLALPTFDKIKNAYTAVSAAQKAYNQAAAIQGEDPTKTHAAAAAAALLKLKVAEEGMSPATKAAVGGIQQLVDSFDKIAKTFAPTVMKVFNDALKVANQLLPTLKQPAQDAAKAIEELLTQFSKFTQSKGFGDWLSSFDKLIGPSVTAIGTGIGKIVIAVGQLITRFSGKDAAHAINDFFDTIAWTINTLSDVIGRLMRNWDEFSSGMSKAWRVIEIAFDDGATVVVGVAKMLADAVLAALGAIIDGAAKAFGWVPGIGGHLKSAAAQFDNFRTSVDDSLGGAEKTLQRWVTHLENAPKIAKFKGDISDLNAKLDAAEKRLNDPNLTKARTARIEANISNVDAQLARVRAELAALNGTTATTYVNTIAGPGTTPGTKKRAAGGLTSGLTLVGERGPELVLTPPGSYVYNHAQSRQMLGGATYNINVSVAPGSEREAGRQIVAAIKKFEAGSGHGWRK